MIVHWPAGMEWVVEAILEEIKRWIDGVLCLFYRILWANCVGLAKVIKDGLPG